MAESLPVVVEPDPEVTGPPIPLLNDDVDTIRVWEPPRHERRVRLFVFLGACLILLPNLGAFGLWDPWETHYGAVTTEMLDTYDWVSPWWGYRGSVGDEKPQGEPFYSKPVFIFWSEAMVSRVIGRGEWALRLPNAMLAILAVYLSYIVASKLWRRRTGLLAALVLATSPFFYMVSRQAQTDMPFVATMTVGLLFLMMALFGPRERMSDKKFMRWTWLTGAFVLLNTLPQYVLLWNDLDDPAPASLSATKAFFWGLLHKGSAHAIIYTLLLIGVGLWFFFQWRRERAAAGGLTDAFKDRWLRKLYLVVTFVFLAQSMYAKGLLGPGLPFAIALCWLIASGMWRALARGELLRGTLIFIATGFPWYVAMFTRHGKPYWDRFIIHDHFKRLGEGVHQIDSGTFEHFIKWLGVGSFPWIAFVPLALFGLLRLKGRSRDARVQAHLFLAMWFLVAFFLFTASSTKFHHYIFPAVPALAVIVALFIDELLDDRAWLGRFAALVGVGLVVAVALDIKEEPQQLRNLMTYKYDRPLPKELPIDADAKVSATGTTTWKDSTFYEHTSPTLQAILQTKAFRYDTFWRFVLIASVIVLALFFVVKTRMAGLVALGLLASATAAWSLNYYMPSLSPHWSQKYLFDSYYETCHKRPLDQETIDAYEPLTVMLGLDALDPDHSKASWGTGLFRGEYKTVCEEDVVTWLITWRGETYYSWNEAIPLSKREQLAPYLEQYNHGKKFYLLIERGKAAGIRSDLKAETDKLKGKGVAGFEDISDWEMKIECDENMYFQMVSATPIKR